MKNKKGWIKILEATIAIMLVSGVLLVMYSRSVDKVDISERVYKLQKEDEQQVAVETDEEGNILSDSYEYAQAKASSGTKYAYSYATRPYSVETFQD